ncbi:hypothetical protein CRG98_045731 [Punica granatum]|uniref:Uncharacterized protein n=1 Tax=Punica granatum TaxID=22663 RepID=A0A2I0HQB5_PUNGR|nr:hypothetical protein CRG98_045731 [Punica granatum]
MDFGGIGLAFYSSELIAYVIAQPADLISIGPELCMSPLGRREEYIIDITSQNELTSPNHQRSQRPDDYDSKLQYQGLALPYLLVWDSEFLLARAHRAARHFPIPHIVYFTFRDCNTRFTSGELHIWSGKSQTLTFQLETTSPYHYAQNALLDAIVFLLNIK